MIQENEKKELKDVFINSGEGKLIKINDIDESQIDQGYLIKALQKQNRFSGNSKIAWQVAQHSLLVSQILKDDGYSAEVQLAGLLHDLSESLINDIVTPIKRQLDIYLDYERLLENQLMHHYGLKDLEEYPEYIKADETALYAEANILVGLNSAWAKMKPEKFSDKKAQQYMGYIKTECPDIVAGRMMVRLIKLLDEAGLDVPEVKNSSWYKEYDESVRAYGDVYDEIIPILAHNQEVYMINLNGWRFKQYRYGQIQSVSDYIVKVLRTSKNSWLYKLLRGKGARLSTLNRINELADLMYYSKIRRDSVEQDAEKFGDNGNVEINKAILTKLFSI